MIADRWASPEREGRARVRLSGWEASCDRRAFTGEGAGRLVRAVRGKVDAERAIDLDPAFIRAGHR